ncbi:DNA polymerase Y family protein [Pseudofrankia asymbiotica]|uniref:DNA repair protein n=1 Tax=Pseudofrankia asymbiotica TaxID=1834516 RepID=A0A1V2IC82_9ACTN|nr:DNA repair protein [Pseudofrankia asymbiotica]ONH30499.1 DNA repair protein [Pseudofrankia asymbiotica]
MPVRMLALHCGDWPTTAAGASPEVPAAVIEANQVVAVTRAARAAGVLPGLRRRDAQGRCPELRLLPADPERDARVFEPVVAAVETVVPGAEVTQPGDCLIPVRGAARYFGAEALVIAQVRGAVAAALAAVAAGGAATAGGPRGSARRSGPRGLGDRAGLADGGGQGRGSAAVALCSFGIADGPFAAAVAARLGETVPAGAGAGFLAPLPVELLDRPELAGLLRRLGLPTLGAFAALPAGEVLARFGPDGVLAHRLARGDDERLPAPRVVPPDLTVETELDPPADNVDQVVFTARRLAEDAHARLLAAGLACARVAIEAETEHGEHLRRVWRHDGPLTAAAITDRIRWQLDGWLSAANAAGGPAGRAAPAAIISSPSRVGRPPEPARIIRIRVTPQDLLAADGRQLGLWGEPGAADGRVRRALDRVQGLLGPEAVLTAEVRGGRDPLAAVRLVPWGEPRGPRGPAEAERAAAPWPGRLPPPAPATVLVEPRPAELLDAAGESVVVSGRATATGAPTWLSVDGRPPVRVVGWAGPWPVDERWWEAAGRRRARFQLVTENGSACLLYVEAGRWWWEASYG